MWPLLACSVALGAALAERLWAHATRRPWETLAAQPATRPGIHPFFWEIPPQIGLLGTVIGLVQIFRGGLGPEAFGRGVGVACITTVFGLSLALIARSADHLFVAWAAGRSRKGDNTLFHAQCDAQDGSNSLFPERKKESDPEAGVIKNAAAADAAGPATPTPRSVRPARRAAPHGATP